MSDHSACPRPCSSCPWLTENHGKPHPDGWYTKRNRDRLWSKLRRGDSMSCHKTDEDNHVPEGHPTVKPGTDVRECTGALILQQREMMHYQDEVLSEGTGGDATFHAYRQAHPKGLTLAGLRELLARALFGGVPVIGGAKMTKPNLNEPVSHTGLSWTKR